MSTSFPFVLCLLVEQKNIGRLVRLWTAAKQNLGNGFTHTGPSKTKSLNKESKFFNALLDVCIK
jgi:hypothetical protein